MTSIVSWSNLTHKPISIPIWCKLLLVAAVVLFGTPLLAQEPVADSTETVEFIDENTDYVGKDSMVALQDTILPLKGREKKESILKPKRHSPKLAAIMSGVLPGAGQVYNRKYWKVPIIYGAFAGVTYLAAKSHRNYITYRDGFRAVVNDSLVNSVVIDGQPYNQTKLGDLRDLYKRNRDMAFVFMGVIYGLQILDAAVDAHLFDFDISDNLSMQIHPVFEPAMDLRQSFTGVRLNLRL